MIAVIQFFTEHSGLWRCVTTPSLVTKCSVVQKISSDKHSLTFWFIAVTLTLNAVIQFFHRTLHLMMQYYQTKFGCKWNSNLEDIVEIVIFCLFKLAYSAGALNPVNHKRLHQSWTQASLYLQVIHFTGHYTTSHVFWACSYSADTQHGNLHPVGWPVLFCGLHRNHVLATANTGEIGRDEK